MERLRKEIRAMLINTPERPEVPPGEKTDGYFRVGYTTGFQDALIEVLAIVDELEDDVE